MTNTYQDVEDFHTKFQVPVSQELKLLNKEELEFRVKFLQEELDEFVKANKEGDLEEAIDALIDLVYVAHGTASWMGIRTEQWKEHWDEVQGCNLQKIMVENENESKRGFKYDIKKPDGWKKPNHQPIIEKYLK